MDREALERSLARMLIDHIENRTTDFSDSILEVSTDVYSQAHQDREIEVLFKGRPVVFCLSGTLPGPHTYRTVDMCGTPVWSPGTPTARSTPGQHLPPPRGASRRRRRPGPLLHLPLPRLVV
jgi:hypothetical protein